MGTMGELSNQWAIFYRYAVTWDEIVKQQAVFGSKNAYVVAACPQCL
jgi:hypothetical protein